MIKARHQPVIRNRWSSLLALAALAITVPVSACGSSSSGHSTASSTAGAMTATQAACQQVSAALSDGPDPGTDPVGYAEAQVLPLQQIHTSAQGVGSAITTLASAYQSYYQADGKGSSVNSALTSAMNRINKLCPGAGASA